MNPEDVVLSRCLVVKKEERCLIITDSTRLAIAKRMLEAAEKITTAELIEIPELTVNGQEPPSWCAKKMLEHDVIIIMTSKSLSHTKARAAATKKGARLASMPGITDEIMQRAIDIDYSWMQKTTDTIADLLDAGKKVRITTKLGTDITFDIEGRTAHGRRGGSLAQKGEWGNLPEGEAYLAPVEGKTNGVYIVDASQAGIGKLKEPIKITVKDGLATNFEGGKEASRLKDMLSPLGRLAFNIAELGIGTNPKAIISGVVLEDEKVFGTCHIALGNNMGFGGNVDVPVHVDGILRSPTIYIDDDVLMKEGKFWK